MNSNIHKPNLWFFLLCIIPLLGAGARGEENRARHRGFIRILNAVSVGSGKLDVMVNGTKIRSEGYDFGDVTGGIPKVPDSYKVSFEREGLMPGETKIAVLLNETITLIPFGEFVPASDEIEAHWIIRILRLKQSEDREQTTATIINLTRKEEIKVHLQKPDESWATVHVRRLGLSRTPILQKHAYVPMRVDENELDPLSVGTSGNFVAVVYEDENGRIQSRNFQDLRYLSLE